MLYAGVSCTAESNHILPDIALGIKCNEIKSHALQNVGNLITPLSCPCGIQAMTESFVHEQDYIVSDSHS